MNHQLEDNLLMAKMAPDLLKAAEELDRDTIKEYLSHGYDVNYSLTAN